MELPQTIFSTVGYWALGVVVVYMAASAAFRIAFVAGDYIHDLSAEMQALFGRILFGTFTLALTYLVVWGCYLIGEQMFAFMASFF